MVVHGGVPETDESIGGPARDPVVGQPAESRRC